MNVDFMHNQIIRDTVTPKFIESFNDNLVPYLMSQYGSMLDEIQFYEDHLTSGLRIGGEFYYPLTIVVNGKPEIRAVKWQVSNYRHYDKFNPFSYKGTEPLEFTLLDEIPEAVCAAVAGKPIYADTGASVPVMLTSAAEDKTFLAGKYSQGFVDLFAKAMTKIIEDEFDIKGLAASGVVIEFHFAPGTFMEHIIKNTTYRRVLIKARGCAARDLWVKWTRLDGKGTYTISDNVSEDEIEFALAEDVSGKIREKEYRYLTAEGAAKYQASMGRKNITEWREMMRRVIRRGEVEKLDTTEEITITPPTAVDYESIAAPAVEEAPAPALDGLAAFLEEDIDEIAEAASDDDDDDLSALLKSAIGLTSSVSAEVAEVVPEVEELVEEIEAEEEDEEPVYEEDTVEDEEPVTVVADTALEAKLAEERMRYEIEQRIRAEMEAEMKRKEAEAEELRARLEEKLRAEAREKELLAQEAKAALLEQQRLEREREAAEAKAREEAALRAEEARRAEEEARRAEIRREEEARIRAEMEAKAKAEAEAAKAEAEDEINYVSKNVKLFFKQQIDPSITKRIHEIILATIKYYHKEDVYIKIKANIPDITTVNLQFVKIPENEIPLLVNIIKVLGRSDLGITRASLD